MDTTTALAGAVGFLALVVLVLVVLVVRLSSVVRGLTGAIPEPLPQTGSRLRQELEPVEEPDYVITRVGLEDEPGVPVPDRVVLSATLGEPLVKAIALGHGVRRALGAEARNRIRFEMRREVKRARKDRRREMRDAWRQVRAEKADHASAVGAAPAVPAVPQQRREDVA